MVYLIHFERPYQHARHYIGYTDNLDQRIHDHECNAHGARLLQVVREAGIHFVVVRTWPDGDPALERKLKRQKKAWMLCPMCKAERRGPNEVHSHNSRGKDS